MINRCTVKPVLPSRVALAALALALAIAGWAGLPKGAAADTRCNEYCSGPGKNYKECMDRCIEREDPRHAERSIRELCRSRGQDELACLREHGLAGGYPPPPPVYAQPPVYAPPPVYVPAPPPPPVYQQPIQCYRDQYGRTVCPP